MKKNCSKGYSCKGTCISKSKNCRLSVAAAAPLTRFLDAGETSGVVSGGTSGESRPGIHTALIERGRKVIGEDLIQALEAALGEDERIIELKKKAAPLDAEFAVLFDKDEAAAFKSPVWKKLLEIQAPIDKIQKELDERAENIMGQIRDRLRGISRAEAEALASNVTIMKSAAKLRLEGEVLELEDELRTRLADVYEITGGKGASLRRIKSTDPRPYADTKNLTMNIGKEDDLRRREITVWHEVGHFVEHESEETRAALESWAESRATGKLQPLRDFTGQAYDPDEYAYPGNFIHPYVGKMYASGATEVLSMGLQHFANTSDMLSLYRRDREHFFITVGALR